MHQPRPLNPPNDATLLPRFPITIEGDIPFLLVTGYTLAGFPEPPQMHVDYFRKQGTLRARPLVPASDPFQAIEEFANSPRWPFTEPEGLNSDALGKNLLMEQALRLMDSVYRPEADTDGWLLPPGGQNVELRKKILAEVSSLKIRWDANSHKYVLLDGTSLPNRSSERPEMK